MSFNRGNQPINPERLEFLLEKYSLSPQSIAESRRFMSGIWHVLQGEKPIDDIMSQEEILHKALEENRTGTIGSVKKCLSIRPPRIYISESDLHLMQDNKTKLFLHPNHQRYVDIPYALQVLKEVIGTDDKTHVVMKKGIPFIENTLISGGGIMLLRGKDAKRQRIINKSRSKKGRIPLDLASEFPELLHLKELPYFLRAFTEKEDRNIMIFPQGERQKERKKRDPFVFDEKKVIPKMQDNIDATHHCIHVIMAIDYRGRKYVDVTLKVISEDEMRDGILGNTVNGFLGEVKNNF